MRIGTQRRLTQCSLCAHGWCFVVNVVYSHTGVYNLFLEYICFPVNVVFVNFSNFSIYMS